MKLIFTKGLPASGKSSWAADFIADNKPGTYVRVNKDLLREMLHSGRAGKLEKQIVAARNALVESFLSQGVSVIVDDTNFNPVHELTLRAMAVNFNAEFHVKDFTHVPVETCIERDKKRPKSVGEEVIRKMDKQYLHPDLPPPAVDPALPYAVICDLDGTVALLNGRSPYDASTCENDLPNEAVIDGVKAMTVDCPRGHFTYLIFCSGREEKYRVQTEKWLYAQGMAAPVYMRKTGDNRKDAVIKKEIYEAHIKGKYNVKCVWDDRRQVVELWRSLGLTCFQVAPGNF